MCCAIIGQFLCLLYDVVIRLLSIDEEISSVFSLRVFHLHVTALYFHNRGHYILVGVELVLYLYIEYRDEIVTE
jgi:hypothetical protein